MTTSSAKWFFHKVQDLLKQESWDTDQEVISWDGV